MRGLLFWTTLYFLLFVFNCHTRSCREHLCARVRSLSVRNRPLLERLVSSHAWKSLFSQRNDVVHSRAIAAAAAYPEARITRFGTDWGCGKCAITHIAIGTRARHYTNHQKAAETWHVTEKFIHRRETARRFILFGNVVFPYELRSVDQILHEMYLLS